MKLYKKQLLPAMVILIVANIQHNYTAPLLAKTYSSPKKIAKQSSFPPDFGKKHFIVGQTLPAFQRQTSCTKSTDNTLINEAYFAPDDNIQEKLINYINQEQKSIFIAIFSFTDKDIANTLCNAHKRGVHIEVITDSSCLSDRFSKTSVLQENGITVYLYNPNYAVDKKTTMSDIMHNKFALFGNNIQNRPLLWTGSFNFTNSARLSNQENVIVTDQEKLVKQFNDHFKELRKRTIPYNPPPKSNKNKTTNKKLTP